MTNADALCLPLSLSLHMVYKQPQTIWVNASNLRVQIRNMRRIDINSNFEYS